MYEEVWLLFGSDSIYTSRPEPVEGRVVNPKHRWFDWLTMSGI
jgi:hypothetical protein